MGDGRLCAWPSHQGLLLVSPDAASTRILGVERYSPIYSLNTSAKDMAVTKTDPHKALEVLRKALSK